MSTWTDTRVTEFRSRYDAGESFAVIAAAMGISRNAAIGKAHRLGLVGRVTSQDVRGIVQVNGKRLVKRRAPAKIFRTLKPAVRVKAERKPVQASPVEIQEPASKRLSLMELSNMECRYIKDDDYLYCGHPVRGESSYCEYHHRIVWKPIPEAGKRNDERRMLRVAA